jgi:hypothetical protein
VASRVRRITLVVIGTMPVTLIAASAFDIVSLRWLALHLLVPALVVLAVLIVRDRDVRATVRWAWPIGLGATALYDVFRFTFLWSGLMHLDPIPDIGVALGLRPAAAVGHLWRYAGNGGGLAIAFVALGLRGVRWGVAYGLAVCAGLLLVLAVSPLGQQMLFPLNGVTVIMATGGHMIYGAVLGAGTADSRRALRSQRPRRRHRFRRAVAPAPGLRG